MIPRRAITLIFTTCCLLHVCCSTDQHTAELISHAESIAIEHPDSALSIIRSVIPNHIRGKHNKAHYQLVYSEALYYNRIFSDNDSITRPMANYYMTSDNHNERTRALYQHANVLKSSGNNAEAMLNLMNAEKSFEHISNCRLKGLIYSTKGEIYGMECLYNNALEEYHKAKNMYEEAGLEYHKIYTDYNIAQTYNKLRQFDNAECYFYKALYYALAQGINEFAIDILYSLIIQYSENAQYEKLSNLIEEHDDLLITHQNLYHLYAGIRYAYIGDKENAINSLNLAQNYNADFSELEYCNYIVYRILNNEQMALIHIERCVNLQNETVLSSLNAPLLNMQIELLKQESHTLQIKNNNIKLWYTLVSICLIGLIASIMLYYHYRQAKQKRDIEKYIAIIEELKTALRSLPDTMNKQIDTLYKSRFNELNKLCDIYYDSTGSSRQMKIVFKQLQNIIESIKNDKVYGVELERIINEHCDNIVDKLYKQCPKLSERQKRIAIYCYAGFSLRAIAIFMDSNPTQISKDKYKIKSLIANSNAINSDKLIEYL